MKRLCALILTLVLTLSLFAGIPVQAASVVAKGIDVSAWQGTINWNAVKADSHGNYAILRAYCAGKDTYFDTNYANAKAAGVPIGAYCFIYGTTTAAVQAEVNAFLQVIQGKQFEYPIYIDIEDDNYYPYSKDYNANLVKMACQMLEDAGFYAGVYTYLSFTQSYVNMNLLTEYTTWIAHYASSCGYTGAYDMWQYGCTGSVGGISPVDVNYCYTDLPSKIKAAGKNGYTPPPTEQQKFDEKDLVTYDNNGWKQQWHITTGRSTAENPIDEFDVAQEFRPTDTVLKGVQLFMKVGTTARIKIGIGTTQDNKNIYNREFQVNGNQHEGWYSFDFQQDVNVTKGNLYYLFVRIVSSNSYGLMYTNKNSVSSSCPIRAHIRKTGGTWGKTEKCIGFNMLSEYGMVRYPFPVDGNTMMIYDGDSIGTASAAYSTNLSLDRSYRREGTASLKMDCTNPVSHSTHTVGGFAYIRMARAVDLSKYNYFSYQLYLPKDMTSNSRFQVNYTTTGEDGYNSIVNITGWKAGWHTVTIKKDSIQKAVDSADWSKIYNIRLIWFNDDRVATPTYFYFDNLRASVDKPNMYPYEVDDTTMVIHDGEQERAFFDGYATYVYPTASQVAEGEKSIYMVCTKPTGQANSVGGMVFLSLDNAVDLTTYDTFSFSLYLSRDFGGDPNNPQHKLEVAFSSDDVNLGYADHIYLDGWKAGWYHLKGNFSDCVLRTGQVDRWEAISTVRITWYNYGQETGDTRLAIDNFRVNRSSSAAATAVDNMIAALPAQITVSDEAAIVAAREAYTALTENQKTYVTKLAVLEAAEARLEELKQQSSQEALDQAAAKAVEDQIAALPETVTVEDEAAIVDARTNYNGLTETQKGYVTNLAALEDAEDKLVVAKEEAAKIAADKAAAKVVEDQINLLPTQVVVEDEAAITAAREAYEGLTDTQKGYVTNLIALETAEAGLIAAKEEAAKIAADKAAAKVVEDKINALPDEITLEDGLAIAAAREAYEGLTDIQKSYVPNVKMLLAAESAWQLLKDNATQEELDRAAAAEVGDMIDRLPNPADVTLADEEQIKQAREWYDKLTDTQKALILPEKIEKLEACEEALATLKEEIAQVEAMIDALPSAEELTYDNLEEVVAQIMAIDQALMALTEEQQNLVTNQEVPGNLMEIINVMYDNQAAAKVVIDMIDALPSAEELTYDTLEEVVAQIMAIDQALMDLSEERQNLVTNQEVPGELMEVINKMYDDREAAKHVDALIEALPVTVTDVDAPAVEAARLAYDALSQEAKDLVTKLDVLIAAEKALADPEETVTLGDVNNDGKVDAKDALLVLKFAVQKEDLSETQQKAAEVDGQDGINAKDALEILKFAVKKIEKFPVEA